MRWFLISLCVAVILSMAWITVTASLDRSVLQAGEGLWPDPWFLATLMDAYFAFLTFFVWVAYKERSLLTKIFCFAAILTLGNFAISGYILWKLSRMKAFTWEALLLRDQPSV